MTTAVLAPAAKPMFRLGTFKLDSSDWVARIEHTVLPAVAGFLTLGAIGLMLAA
jgi:hypothetical protein